MNPVGALIDYLPHLAVLLLAYYVYRKVSLPGLNLEALLSRFRAPDYLAQRERRAGNFQVAGRMYEELGMPDRAVEAYLAGGEDWAAAAVLEGQRKFDRAAQLYQQSGDRKKAADMFERAGKAAKAAALHLEDGNNLEAARLKGVSGDWKAAADLFLKSGYPLRAAEAFERLGEPLRAAECYDAHFTENVTYSTTFSGGVPAKERKNARRAGELYKAAGELKRSREMFARGEFFKEAALVSLELGDYARAGEHFTRAEELAEAAQAFEQAGDLERAANLRGEVAFKENRVADAAGLFRDGKDYLRAAELFESVEMLAEAAAAFEAGESFPAAAGVYIRAGLPARAAAAFERGGAYEDAARLYEEIGDGAKAAELFERAGQTFKSGLAAADAGDSERAIRLLQKVPPEDESYRAASERLGQLFVTAGRPGLAVERLSKLLGGSVSVSNLELAYWLARAYEARGEHAAAQGLYKKILAEDMTFRDVNARLGAPSLVFPQADDSEPPPPAFGTPPRSVAGEMVGKYRIGHTLGEGAMGRVYAARDTVLERDVALKLMVTADDADMRQRFEREARAVARMTHPNVVTVYDLGQSTTGQAYIAMELLRGSDLRHAMRTAPAIRTQLERKIAVILQVLDGLGHAHAAGIVHRDIKPANVFICHDGVVKIMDFGVARLTTGSMTGTGAVVGTADYMSPEQVSGAAVSGASDLFSVGVMLYELLVGRPPFRADSLMATFYGITHREPDYAPIEKAGLASLRRLLQKALAKKVSERYATAAEFAADLKELLRERSQATGRSMEQLLDLSGTLVGVEATRAAAWEDSGAVPTAPPARESSGSAPTQPRAGESRRASPPLPRPAPPPSPSAESGAPPVTSSRFELERELGRGLLGVVYSAHDKASGKRLALRMLPARTAATAEAHEHLLQDLKAAGRIAHPSIARVLGIDYPSGGTAVLSELVEWPTLEAAVAARTRPTAADAVAIGRALAAALAFAHSKGVVHGSIKPSNVMTGRPHKIVDIGLGRLYAAVDPDSPYRAPEKRLDAAADVFGLGGVLFFMLTGKAPPGANPRPGRHGASVPDALDELVADCLAAEPARRIHSPEGILKRFDAMLSG